MFHIENTNATTVFKIGLKFGNCEKLFCFLSYLIQKPRRTNPIDFLSDFRDAFHRIKSSGSKIDDSAGWPSNESDNTLSDSFEETSDTFLSSSFDWLRSNSGHAVEDAHDQALASSGEALPEVLSTSFLDSFSSFCLKLFVEGERGQALAERAGNS